MWALPAQGRGWRSCFRLSPCRFASPVLRCVSRRTVAAGDAWRELGFLCASYRPSCFVAEFSSCRQTMRNLILYRPPGGSMPPTFVVPVCSDRQYMIDSVIIE
ncbi:hypothetical protein KC19_1G210400 [Ceratodon purpureus]|uniref:Uncharacterized protein n=1 Tax=Ceratodon purpureus TaxID=3225 RepID=A0A8T0J7L6_CERPU|nr:hypothetical protein KC19_1G210400 [Ceratodon purpureus]